MKKIIFIGFILLVVSRISFAQTTPAVNSSYTTQNSPLVVYPFDPATGAADNKAIHFLLNANTKFFISKILDSGYVIRVWPFPDQYKFRDSLKNKKTFYDKLRQLANAKAALAKAKLTQDTLTKAKNAAQVKLDETNKDKINADSELNAANKQFSEAKNNLTNALPKGSRSLKAGSKDAVAKASIIQLSKDLDERTKDFQQAKSAVDSKTSVFLTNISNTSLPTDTAELSKKIADLNKSKKALSTKTSNLNTIQSMENYPKIADAKNTVLNYSKQINEAATSFVASTNNLIKQNIEFKKIKAKLEDADKDVDSATVRVAKMHIHSTPIVQGSVIKPNDTIFKMSKAAANTYIDDITKSGSAAAEYDSLAFVDSWGNYMQFYLPLKDFSDCVQIYPYNDHFTWGFLSVPLKIRVAPFSFEQNINFGLTFGWKFQPVSTVNVSDNILAGISVGSVNLKADPSTPAVTTPTTAAVSFSLGYMFQYDKFQAGAFIGWDVAGQNRSQFANGNTPWIGIAIGLSLFGENSTSAATKTQSN